MGRDSAALFSMLTAVVMNRFFMPTDFRIKTISPAPATIFMCTRNGQAMKQYQGSRQKTCRQEQKTFLREKPARLYKVGVVDDHEGVVDQHDVVASFGKASSRPSEFRPVCRKIEHCRDGDHQ